MTTAVGAAAATAAAASSSASSQVHYTRIADAQRGEVEQYYANVFAVISSASACKATRGSDVLMSLTLVDPSSDAGLKVNVFEKTIERLPDPRCVGCVFRCIKLRIERWNDRIIGVASHSYSHWIIAGGTSLDPVDILLSNSAYTPLSEKDHERIVALRLWSQRDIQAATVDCNGGAILRAATSPRSPPLAARDEVPSPYPRKTKTIAEITPIGTTFDLICMLKYIRSDGAHRDTEECWIGVWDGTDASTAFPCNALQLHHKEKFGTLLQIKASHVDPLYISHVALGSWLHLRDIRCDSVGDPPRPLVRFERQSRIRIIKESNELVQLVLRKYHKRCEQTQAYPNFPSSPTITIHTGAQLSTIREIVNFRVIPYKFRCFVKVSAIAPAKLEDITMPICASCQQMIYTVDQNWLCTYCNTTITAPQRYTYMLQLLLSDSTGEISAILYHNDAEKFFHGIPPVDLHNNQHALEQIREQIERMLHSEGLLEFCIKSYHTNNGDRFQIFDTKLI